MPRHYVCLKTNFPLAEEAWESAPWSEDFVDISTAATPPYRTRFKGLWTEWGLHIVAELEEPHLWATLQERDSIIFHDNDFELFLDPDGDHCLYLEIEVNALNTVWDLVLDRPYRAKGRPLTGFDLKGLITRVHLDGSLNDPSDRDRGWSVEIHLPWSGLAEIATCRCPPLHGDIWKINFSRVQWDLKVLGGTYQKVEDRPEHNWVWSSQGTIDMHRPWNWGDWIFADSEDPVLVPPDAESRMRLVALYEAQRAHRELFGYFAKDLPGFADIAIVAGRHVFEGRHNGSRIDQDSRFTAD